MGNASMCVHVRVPSRVGYAIKCNQVNFWQMLAMNTLVD